MVHHSGNFSLIALAVTDFVGPPSAVAELGLVYLATELANTLLADT